jgi:UDP-3-O-[3-hydroxymyristoyl] glucosamine N-acyltransferase
VLTGSAGICLGSGPLTDCTVSYRVVLRDFMNAKFESVEDDAGKVTRYVRRANGGGLVAPGATVADSTRIGSMTYVENGARIGHGCRIGHGSWIDRDATIGDRTVIGDGVRIGRGTVIGNRVHIGSHSRIGSSVLIEHGVHLEADAMVADGEQVLVDARTPAAARARHRQHRRSKGRIAA